MSICNGSKCPMNYIIGLIFGKYCQPHRRAGYDERMDDEEIKFFNTRTFDLLYLRCDANFNSNTRLLHDIHLWRRINVTSENFDVICEFFKMEDRPNLIHHLICDSYFSNTSFNKLSNLETLDCGLNIELTDDCLKNLPNLRYLKYNMHAFGERYMNQIPVCKNYMFSPQMIHKLKKHGCVVVVVPHIRKVMPIPINFHFAENKNCMSISTKPSITDTQLP